MSKPTFRSAVGHAAHGRNIVFGRDTADRPLENLPPSLIARGCGARRLTPRESQFIDALLHSTIAIDPRIWPLKVPRLIATYGNPLAGQAAGLVALHEAIVGPWTLQTAAALLVELDAVPADDRDAHLRNKLDAGERLSGWGVPKRDADERLPLLRGVLREFGYDDGHFMHIAEAARETVERIKPSMRMNLGPLVAAALLDLGLPVEAIGPFTVLLFAHPQLAPHACEEARLPNPAVRLLPTECVAFVGRSVRRSTRSDEVR